MESLKKLFDFIVLCVYVLASIGGTAYLFYDHHALFGVTNIALVAMACPYFISRIKDIEK